MKILLVEVIIFLVIFLKFNFVCIVIMKVMDELDKEFVKDILNSIKDVYYFGFKEIGRGCGYKYFYNFKNYYVK